MSKRELEIDINKVDLEFLRQRSSDFPGKMEYPHTSGGAKIEFETTDMIKKRSLKAMREQTDRELLSLSNKMKPLIDQANDLKKRIHLSEIIYSSEMKIKPLVGESYYIYRKKDDSTLLSMIGPNDWGTSHPYEEFMCKVKLLSDHTWSILED